MNSILIFIVSMQSHVDVRHLLPRENELEKFFVATQFSMRAKYQTTPRADFAWVFAIRACQPCPLNSNRSLIQHYNLITELITENWEHMWQWYKQRQAWTSCVTSGGSLEHLSTVTLNNSISVLDTVFTVQHFEKTSPQRMLGLCLCHNYYKPWSSRVPNFHKYLYAA